MDPRPPKEAISSLYPENYFTHTDVHQASTIKRSFPLRVWDAVQHAALRRIGYNGEKLEIPLKFLGELLLAFPPIGREATRRVYFLPRLPGGKLLDVGCGNGSFLDQMRTFGWNCEGIEPDPIAAEHARRRGLSIRCSSLEEVNLAPEAYDAITMNHVLEHFFDPQAMIAKLSLALKSGGVLISISPNPVGLLARRFGKAWRQLDPPRHLVLPSPVGCAIMCQNARLKAQVFTCWSGSHWSRSQSRQINACGRVVHTHCSFLDKLYAYSIAPLLNMFLANSGEEVAFVAIRQSKPSLSPLQAALRNVGERQAFCQKRLERVLPEST